MARVTRLILALVACVCWACSSVEQPAQAPASDVSTNTGNAGSTSTGTADVNASDAAVFPAGGELSFAIVPGSCVGSSCAPVVQLRRSNAVIDVAPLDFAPSSAEWRQAPADALLGAGDPLDPAAPPAWTAGEGEAMVTTAARSVKLSAAEAGLLVDQAGGFEHVKRRHYLFVAAADKLQRVWTGEEGAGPAWSATVLVDGPSGDAPQQIVYITGFQPGGDQPDTVAATRYIWNAKQRTLAEAPPGPIYAVVAGNFANLDDARAARTQPCLSSYSAMRGAELGVKGSPFVLAAITTRKALADSARTHADNCATGMIREAVQVTLPARTQ